MDNWSKVFESMDLQYTELLKSLLISEGIEAVSMNKKDSSNIIFGTISLYVPAEMEQKALAIIQSQSGE
ncbi:MAG: putative signal transducing protein [Bacteroidia bacterium]|jgi:hypothetical protein